MLMAYGYAMNFMLHHDNVTLREVVLVCVLLKNGFNLLSVLRLTVPEKHGDST